MDPFKDLQNDWKKIGGGAADNPSNHLLNLKNEEIMKSLVQYEQREKRSILLGTIGGAAGIVTGLGMGIGMPLYKGLITFTPLLGFGIFLMIAALGVIFFGSQPKGNYSNEMDLPSGKYLEQTRTRLIERKRKLLRNGILYVIVLMTGMSLVFYSIAPDDLIAPICMAVAIGIASVLIWAKGYDKKVNPMMKEIDELIEGMR